MTQAERDDARVMAALEERVAGEGGASGVEYEDGRPADLRDGVRRTMYHVIK